MESHFKQTDTALASLKVGDVDVGQGVHQAWWISGTRYWEIKVKRWNLISLVGCAEAKTHVRVHEMSTEQYSTAISGERKSDSATDAN
jgi:hypothetical protein